MIPIIIVSLICLTVAGIAVGFFRLLAADRVERAELARIHEHLGRLADPDELALWQDETTRTVNTLRDELSALQSGVAKAIDRLAVSENSVVALAERVSRSIAELQRDAKKGRTVKIRARLDEIEGALPKITENVNRMVHDLTSMQSTVRSLKSRAALGDMFEPAKEE